MLNMYYIFFRKFCKDYYEGLTINNSTFERRTIMNKEDIKEMVKIIRNKLQIRKDYFITIIDCETGVSHTDYLKLSKKERMIRINEINNDPELSVVNYFKDGIVAII